MRLSFRGNIHAPYLTLLLITTFILFVSSPLDSISKTDSASSNIIRIIDGSGIMYGTVDGNEIIVVAKEDGGGILLELHGYEEEMKSAHDLDDAAYSHCTSLPGLQRAFDKALIEAGATDMFVGWSDGLYQYRSPTCNKAWGIYSSAIRGIIPDSISVVKEFGANGTTGMEQLRAGMEVWREHRKLYDQSFKSLIMNWANDANLLEQSYEVSDKTVKAMIAQKRNQLKIKAKAIQAELIRVATVPEFKRLEQKKTVAEPEKEDSAPTEPVAEPEIEDPAPTEPVTEPEEKDCEKCELVGKQLEKLNADIEELHTQAYGADLKARSALGSMQELESALSLAQSKREQADSDLFNLSHELNNNKDANADVKEELERKYSDAEANLKRWSAKIDELRSELSKLKLHESELDRIMKTIIKMESQQSNLKAELKKMDCESECGIKSSNGPK